MEWLELDDGGGGGAGDGGGMGVGFLDTMRIWNMLDSVRNAPNLYEVATAKFRVTEGAIKRTTHLFDAVAWGFLVEEDFIEVITTIGNDVEKFLQLDRDADRTREDLATAYRRLKTLDMQRRNAAQEAGRSTFLSSKKDKWDREQKLQNVKDELDRITFKRRRLESDLEKAGGLLKSLMDRIYRDQGIRDAHWYGDQPVRLTHHGEFLLEFLEDMNPAHFQGRALAEILEIGGALA